MVANNINLSVAVSLAIHSMALIAPAKTKLNVNTIAKITGVSKNNLSKVLQTYIKYNFIVSCREPNGCFELKRPVNQVTLFELYQLMEGVIGRNYNDDFNITA